MVKNYTNIEQSKKLIKILPLESADMYWAMETIPYLCLPLIDGTTDWDYAQENNLIPAWSLAALLSVLDFPSLTQNKEDEWEVCVPNHKSDGYIEVSANNPIDTCYEMIITLNELKML